MAFAVRAAGNSHWYSKTGVPTYEVPYAASNKAKAGQFRPTTLTDARKMNLLPSVTNILDIKAKPALVNWKLTWAIIAAITTPRIDNETDDAFADRVAAEAESIASEAARFGSRVHQAIEDYIVEGEVTEDPEIRPYFDNWLLWAQENLDLAGTCFAERVVVGDGYAGRADLKVRAKLGSALYQELQRLDHNPEDYGIIDFKTRRWSIKKPEDELKAPTYDSDPSQLSAYVSADISMATEEESDLCASWCASILINSENPKVPVNCKVWSMDEMEQAMKVFNACQVLWMLDREYDPRTDCLAAA